MASTAKYQPAAQREPDDDYTHAPPAYGSTAAESSSSAHDPGLFAQPRSSDDNIPDDFKVSRKENRIFLLLSFCAQDFTKPSYFAI
jgi:hypothetical protein